MKNWETINDILKAANEIYNRAQEDDMTPEKIRTITGGLKVATKVVSDKLALAKLTNHPVAAVDPNTNSLPDIKLY